MTATHENRQPAAAPPIVDRETWHAARDELLVQEKAHMRGAMQSPRPAVDSR